MPNHVHVLIETIAGYPLGEVVHSWKSYTANRANQILRRRGVFWHQDYYDRFIRDQKHFQSVIAYIEANPVKAGLVRRSAEWRWGSSRLGSQAI